MNIIGKFEIGNSVNVESLIEIAQEIRALGFEPPWDFPTKRAGAIAKIFPHTSRPKDARNSWQDCALSFMGPTDGNILKLRDSSDNAEKLIGRLKGLEFKAAQIAKILRFRTKKLHLWESPGALGPAEKIRAL